MGLRGAETHASAGVQSGGDARDPFCAYHDTYENTAAWVKQQPSRLEKPNALEASESAAIVATSHLGSIESLEGAIFFSLKLTNVRRASFQPCS